MAISDEQKLRLERVLSIGVPLDALAFYARWWQLERWLREMVYLELRAKYGAGWKSRLGARASTRASGDVANSYMPSADAEELISYTDVSRLLAVIRDEWPLFAPFLPAAARWEGMVDVLSDIRNRNAHCRRPHRDDLGRIEQTLRDLESGAWTFYSTFARTHEVDSNSADPLAEAWVGSSHQTARRLIRHADSNYDTSFRLRYTVRPWASATSSTPNPGEPGMVWKADWMFHSSDYEVHPRRLWQRIRDYNDIADHIIFLEASISTVTASFAAVDDPGVVADAIGGVFDSILETSRGSGRDLLNFEAERERWKQEIADLPARVQIDTAMTLTDPYGSQELSIFDAD